MSNGKELHVFRRTRKGFARYDGEFTCTSWEYARAPDTAGEDRQAIVFHLVPAGAAADLEAAPPSKKAGSRDLAELRRRAYEAAAPAGTTESKSARRNYCERSVAVREYVLARADGLCESCKERAPFRRKDGSPYLEPHHVRRVSDGGPDHPQFVAAVCPTCHRRAHHGEDASAFNAQIAEKLATIEAEPAPARTGSE